jgi:hypothetical protein
MQKLKDNYSSSLKSMRKTISPSLIILTMIHNLGFVSSAASIFVTLDVIWILVMMTFSPIYIWLEQYIYMYTQTCEMVGFQSWWIMNVQAPWVLQCFYHLFFSCGSLPEGRNNDCRDVFPKFNRTGKILLKLVVHYISRHQDHYQNLYANCFPGNGAKKLVGIL